MACFFWTSVREKPEKTDVDSVTMALSKHSRKIEENSIENLFSRYLYKILYNAVLGFIKLFDISMCHWNYSTINTVRNNISVQCRYYIGHNIVCYSFDLSKHLVYTSLHYEAEEAVLRV